MKRFCIVLVIMIILTSIVPTAADSTKYTTKYDDYANKLKEIGVFNGTSSGFELDRTPTRLEAAVMLVRLLGAEKEAQAKKYQHPFKDVPEWAASYVGYMYHEKLTQGTSATTFGSNDIMPAKSYFTFILRALGYNDAAGDFSWSQSLEFAKDKGLIADSDYNELNSATFYRDQLAKVSYMALKMPLKGNAKSLLEKLIDLNAIDKDKAGKIGLISNTPIVYQKPDFFQEKYGIKDYQSYKNIYVFSNDNLDEFCNLLKVEGLKIDQGFPIRNFTQKYIQDNYLIVISAEYSMNELPPFITNEIKIQDYYSIDKLDEHMVFQVGKATIMIIEKKINSQAFDYLSPSTEVDYKSPGIEELAEQITKDANSDTEKAKAIYHWVCNNITYESYYEEAKSGKDWLYLTYASNVLQSKKTNCKGYSNLYAALNRAVGIKVKVVGGWYYEPNNKESMFKEEYRHAWNEIFIGDKWVSVDATMGAKPSLKDSYTYFNVDPETFANDHIRDSVLDY